MVERPVGVYGTSYEGQAAELIAGLGNAYLVAVAALFSPYDPYRELFYPGGCGTGGRYARWMYESQLKDGIAGALDRLAALTGQAGGDDRAAVAGEAGGRAGRAGLAGRRYR